MTIGDALLYPFYIGLFYSSAMSLLGIIYSWNGFLVQGGRVSDFLYKPTDLPHLVCHGQKAPQEIDLINIEVRHRGFEPLTATFDLKIKRQEILLIHGPSGSGKTTLMEMLAGLRPFHGGSLSDSAKVRSLANQDPGLWLLPTQWSLYIEQRPYLFEGTVRSNLLIGNPSVTDDRLWEVLTQVHLAGFVTEVGGLDYELTDQGGNLSEGQKYRLIVARALLADRAFYFFDEPFAALDPFSIAAMCNVFLYLSRVGCGVVVVSHTKPDLFRVDRQLDFQGIIRDSAQRCEPVLGHAPL
jgi:ATP-binding cassette subfamily B protein